MKRRPPPRVHERRSKKQSVALEVVAEPVGETEVVKAADVETHILGAWTNWRAGASSTTTRARDADLRSLAVFLDLDVRGTSRAFAAAREVVLAGPARCRSAIIAWLADQKDQGLAATTRSRRLSTIKSWLEELREFGLAWTLRLKGPKFDPYQRAEGPPPAEVELVIADLTQSAQTSPLAARDLAQILLLYDSGLRQMSVAGLDVEHLRLRRKTPAVVVVTKGHPDPITRTVSSRAAQALQTWLSHRGRYKGPLWRPVDDRGRPGSGRMTGRTIANACKRHGWRGTHCLRHSAATALSEMGATTRQIQEFLGHRCLATTQVYLDKTADLAGEATRMVAGESEDDDEG